MHRTSLHLGHLILHSCRLAVPLVLLAGFVASAPIRPERFAATDSTFPVIAHITGSEERPGELVLAGHGFAPGGLVYIVIHDLWGMARHETRWITASEISYQPPHDLDPGEGFSFDTGGNVAEWFDIEIGTTVYPRDSQNPALGPVTGMPTTMAGVDCTTSLMVMAYDRSSATWSNTVEIDLGCAG